MIVSNGSDDALHIPGNNNLQEEHAKLLRENKVGEMDDDDNLVNLTGGNNLLEEHAKLLKEIEANEGGVRLGEALSSNSAIDDDEGSIP